MDNTPLTPDVFYSSQCISPMPDKNQAQIKLKSKVIKPDQSIHSSSSLVSIHSKKTQRIVCWGYVKEKKKHKIHCTPRGARVPDRTSPFLSLVPKERYMPLVHPRTKWSEARNDTRSGGAEKKKKKKMQLKACRGRQGGRSRLDAPKHPDNQEPHRAQEFEARQRRDRVQHD